MGITERELRQQELNRRADEALRLLEERERQLMEMFVDPLVVRPVMGIPGDIIDRHRRLIKGYTPQRIPRIEPTVPLREQRPRVFRPTVDLPAGLRERHERFIRLEDVGFTAWFEQRRGILDWKGFTVNIIYIIILIIIGLGIAALTTKVIFPNTSVSILKGGLQNV